MPSNHPTQQNTEHSIAKADIRTRVGRRRVSFRCDPKVWKDFKLLLSAQGDTICHILEGLICAYTYPQVLTKNHVRSSPTMHVDLTVVREVKRVRRQKPLSDKIDFEDGGSFKSCNICDKQPAVVVFYWLSRSVCRRVFYCQEHWEERKPLGDYHGYRIL